MFDFELSTNLGLSARVNSSAAGPISTLSALASSARSVQRLFVCRHPGGADGEERSMARRRPTRVEINFCHTVARLHRPSWFGPAARVWGYSWCSRPRPWRKHPSIQNDSGLPQGLAGPPAAGWKRRGDGRAGNKWRCERVCSPDAIALSGGLPWLSRAT
jgi:hypothetical protein